MLIGNMVTIIRAKFNYDRLHTDKVLGNWKSDNNKKKKKKNNVCSTWGPFPGLNTTNDRTAAVCKELAKNTSHREETDLKTLLQCWGSVCLRWPISTVSLGCYRKALPLPRCNVNVSWKPTNRYAMGENTQERHSVRNFPDGNAVPPA